MLRVAVKFDIRGIIAVADARQVLESRWVIQWSGCNRVKSKLECIHSRVESAACSNVYYSLVRCERIYLGCSLNFTLRRTHRCMR